MKNTHSNYREHRFSLEFIGRAIWLSYKFGLSLREVEEARTTRGIAISNQTIRRRRTKFGLDYAKRLIQREVRFGIAWLIHKNSISIYGQRPYLRREVGQDGEVIGLQVRSRRKCRLEEFFFLKLLKGPGKIPSCLVTDRLTLCKLAFRTSFLRSTTTLHGAGTIERNSHTNQPAGENSECDRSSLHGRLNSSSRRMASFGPFFDCPGPESKRFITRGCGTIFSDVGSGRGRLANPRPDETSSTFEPDVEKTALGAGC